MLWQAGKWTCVSEVLSTGLSSKSSNTMKYVNKIIYCWGNISSFKQSFPWLKTMKNQITVPSCWPAQRNGFNAFWFRIHLCDVYLCHFKIISLIRAIMIYTVFIFAIHSWESFAWDQSLFCVKLEQVVVIMLMVLSGFPFFSSQEIPWLFLDFPVFLAFFSDFFSKFKNKSFLLPNELQTTRS